MGGLEIRGWVEGHRLASRASRTPGAQPILALGLFDKLNWMAAPLLLITTGRDDVLATTHGACNSRPSPLAFWFLNPEYVNHWKFHKPL
jgi:hypothetical protein